MISNLLDLDIEESDLEEKQEMPMMIPGQGPLPPNGKPDEEPKKDPKEPLIPEADT